MFSLRALSRAVPKATFRPVTSRYLSTLPKTSALRSSWTAVSRPTFRTFTTSPYRWEPAGQVDTELSAKLEQELSLEKESQTSEEIPEGLKEFIDVSGFEVHDTPGKEEVVLTKQFGDEQIKVTFSIADLNEVQQQEEYDDMDHDSALGDEHFDDEGQSAGPRSKGTINAGSTPDGNMKIAPEDRVAPADRPELAETPAEDMDGEDDASAGFPVNVDIVITKSNGGALRIETTASDGAIDIDDVHYFPSADLADVQSAEKNFQRADIYSGPPFGNLDGDLQLLFERYLEERGIDPALAQFIPDYIDFKEQREYVKWLDSVKGFIDA